VPVGLAVEGDEGAGQGDEGYGGETRSSDALGRTRRSEGGEQPESRKTRVEAKRTLSGLLGCFSTSSPHTLSSPLARCPRAARARLAVMSQRPAAIAPKLVSCPSCSRPQPMATLNVHLDACLAAPSSPPSSTLQPSTSAAHASSSTAKVENGDAETSATQQPRTPGQGVTRTAPMFMRRDREAQPEMKRRRTGTSDAPAAAATPMAGPSSAGPSGAGPSGSPSTPAARLQPPMLGGGGGGGPSMKERLEALKPLAERMRPKTLAEFVVRTCLALLLSHRPS
jgi:hypothetical protein